MALVLSLSSSIAGAAEAQSAAKAPTDKLVLRPTSVCIDQEIADRLAVQRQRREVKDRLFIKQARHELSAGFGYYISDLYSSTYIASAAYTYHMTESTAVELSGGYTHADAEVIDAIEDGRGDVIADDYARILIGDALIVLSPVTGKLRLGGAIAHFDIHIDGGFGVIDSQTSRGAAGVAGLGAKLYLGDAVAVRIDLRDHVHRPALLDTRFWSNDLSVSLGMSLFLPLSP
ncbi:MAG TPA: outer membrane beta-barrel domain-containing protein [Kofleriaceae bacterium]|nr:outer membrane beta-barrel domain-containing protein [Kofleriaceae bacterium]